MTTEQTVVETACEVIQANLDDIRKELPANLGYLKVNISNIETWIKRIQDVAKIPTEDLV